MGNKRSFRVDFKEFIERCKTENQYDDFIFFEETYKNLTTKTKMQCKKCGDIFYRKPSNHLSLKPTCGKCCGTKQHTKETFIEEANKKHNNKFSYEKVVYVNNKVPVIITCPIHGDFKQRPDDHLKGVGCSGCSGLKKKTTEEFIKDAVKIHGDLYDYSLVDYQNNQKKVKIICKKHGVFEQKPNLHLSQKCGCSKCLYKNETLTGKSISDLLNIEEPKKKRLFINKGEIRTCIVDFYFNHNGKTIIVEYNGSQHYTDRNWNGKGDHPINDPKRFERQQLRDKKLREYCNERNILLIEIDGRSYYGEKIKEYLEKQFVKYSLI